MMTIIRAATINLKWRKEGKKKIDSTSDRALALDRRHITKGIVAGYASVSNRNLHRASNNFVVSIIDKEDWGATTLQEKYNLNAYE